MVIDVLRAYVQVASGLTELTRERAMTAAKALISQASTLSDAPAESSAQVRALADELAKAARGNRDIVLGMVRAETERAVAAVGAASLEDVDALRRRVDELERRLNEQSVSGAEAADAAPAKKAAAGKKTAPAKKAAPVKKTASAPSAAKRAGHSPSASGVERQAPTSVSPDAGFEDLDIPTPAEVEQVVAKKNAAKKTARRTAKSTASSSNATSTAGGDGTSDAAGQTGDSIDAAGTDSAGTGTGIGTGTGTGTGTGNIGTAGTGTGTDNIDMAGTGASTDTDTADPVTDTDTDGAPVQDPTPPDVSTA